MVRSREEYDAAAMLIGMVYDSWTHTFRRLATGKTLRGQMAILGALDADTLEPLERGELNRKQKADRARKQFGNWMVEGRVTGYSFDLSMSYEQRRYPKR